MIDINIDKRLLSGTGPMDLQFKLTMTPGKVTGLYGASGSGKTSIIRMIAGLMRPDFGTLQVNNELWFDHINGVNRSPQRRNIGVVFQDPALFPNMTVRQNIEYAKHNGAPSDTINEILELMELGSLAERKPQLLSGGQQQRVALARAIIRKPAMLLLDEPTSAMDTNLRLKMQDYILTVQRKFEMTIIVVSHDILEILRLADHAITIDNGKITSQGVPSDILPVKQLKDLISKL